MPGTRRTLCLAERIASAKALGKAPVYDVLVFKKGTKVGGVNEGRG